MEPVEASGFSERQEAQQSQSMEGQLVLTFYVVLSQKYTKSALIGCSSASSLEDTYSGKESNVDAGISKHWTQPEGLWSLLCFAMVSGSVH